MRLQAKLAAAEAVASKAEQRTSRINPGRIEGMATDPYEPPEIIALAQGIADEFGVGLRVEGWIGATGHQGQEFAINLNGQRCALELGEQDILGFASDQQARMRVEERIRHQLKTICSGS